ncbi:NHL repeat-containing protein [Amycolatopsis sp. H20-H5]|uniref:NHL repeat-containing protein n=1 Tax=Amycolatopsis sp. H20-H5 TaxID=3046309 RepID=UPI002DBF1403|nr:NHL repeat-containing protein [Amycolatopsis sp. H20-H5]MEC3979950.1 NHL repeat-containing protein [Amycolatopsis sp. H20-H5]
MPVTGTLIGSASSVEQGEPIAFTYSTPPASVTPKNWVGLYADPGNGPVDQRYVGASTLWEYVPQASGAVSFGSGALGAGDYIAFYLSNDGYSWLADPVKFSVRPTPQTEPPVFRDAFGCEGRGPGQFAAPSGITVDARGQVWVADTGNDRVQAFSRDGRLVRVLAGRLKAPQAVAVDGGGNVYVADTGNNRVAQYAWWGGFVREFGAGKLDNPRGVAVDAAGRLVVSDTGHQRIARYDTRTGAELAAITEKVSSPQGITPDGAGGFWVAQNGRAASGSVAVVRYSAEGKVIGSIGYGQSSEFGGLSNPSDVAVNSTGDAYITVPDYCWVAQFRTAGPYRAEFGLDGKGTLSFPLGVAVDAQNRVFVADTGNNRIVHFGVS